MSAPILIFSWGNPSRGDDALGPLFAEVVQAQGLAGTDVDYLTDFQLQVEHALDLHERKAVLFVDASTRTDGPAVSLERIWPEEDHSFSSHALSPQAVLHVFQELQDIAPPPAWQLAIRGESFELGQGLSAAAETHLQAALLAFQDWYAQLPELLLVAQERPDHELLP